MALQSLPLTRVTLSVAGAAACLSGAGVVGRMRRRPPTPVDCPVTPDRTGDVELAVVAGFVFCALPAISFSPPSSLSAGLGLYVHFLGYALAFTVFYAADAAGLLDRE